MTLLHDYLKLWLLRWFGYDQEQELIVYLNKWNVWMAQRNTYLEPIDDSPPQ